jgi:hypothetical protein
MRGALMVSCLLVLTCGCGGSGGGQTSEGGGTQGAGSGSETTASASGPSTPWDEMTSEQKGQYMAEVVMPEMRRLFQEHDAEEYADFSCATCHGDNAHDVGFRMPNGLAPLDPAQIPAMFQSDHPGAVFMTQRVWPRMGELLGEPLYNPETHEGFACLNCHANGAPAAAAQ